MRRRNKANILAKLVRYHCHLPRLGWILFSKANGLVFMLRTPILNKLLFKRLGRHRYSRTSVKRSVGGLRSKSPVKQFSVYTIAFKLLEYILPQTSIRS